MNDTYWTINEPFLNVSLEEIQCFISFYSTASFYITENDSTSYCNTTWDGVSCWPTSPGGAMVEISCFGELHGVRYDTSQNASRMCYENGTWARRSDYSRCTHLQNDPDLLKVLWDVKEATTIYFVGYGISLVALFIALWIFLYFKDLRCLRNTIHTHLIVTYILIDLVWIITASLQMGPSSSLLKTKTACILTIFLTYLMGTNFFWMFVEGLYLYILVIKTFSIDFIKFHLYAAIGWGLPALVILIWAPVKAYFSPLTGDVFLQLGCPWQSKDNYDYIFIVPVIAILMVNIFFLARIMWVLITKLRAATTVEQKQYRKAAKALLVLIPLLGVTYVLVIVTPNHRTARIVFTYLQATLLSTQGLTVAILYCFFNGEVRNSLRHHVERWKMVRTLGGAPRHSISYRPSQHGEVLNSYTSRRSRGRGSCISFTTTTSFISGSNHNAHGGHNKHCETSFAMLTTKPDAI
ncbi:diuretic hormone receptor-like isoform X2 [Tachypleus tridentatus]|uniref:diuretic hormone receptor-like isoform X2 n=1 Tax=Tachypleus tridentatus TaxID=6853 RepID=UPI003FD05C75